jgi:signal peptidase I
MDKENNKKSNSAIDTLYSSIISILYFLWDLIKTALIVALIAFIIRWFLIEPFIVQGSSMEPNFHNYDYLLIEKVSDEFKQGYQRGAVVVFHPPGEKNQNYIKRIIGLPGEEVFIRDNKVVIQNQINPKGFTLDEPYLDPEEITQGEHSIQLEDNQYYLLGDNRDNSKDSRTFGPVNENQIIGKACLKLVSTTGAEIIDTPDY